MSMLDVFTLEKEFSPDEVNGLLVRTRKHDDVRGAYTYEFKTPRGKIFATAIKGKLQEIAYYSPSFFPWQRKKKLAFLLSAYAQGEWKNIHKNKAERFYHSADEQYYASISDKTRYFCFGTMLFHDEKFRAVT